MTQPEYMICHVEDGAAYPLAQFDTTLNRAEAVYDLLTWLDEAIRGTAIDTDHNLTVTSGAVTVVACDAEYSVQIVEIDFVEGRDGR